MTTELFKDGVVVLLHSCHCVDLPGYSDMKSRKSPNVFGEFNVIITFNILVISVLISAVITTAYGRIREEKHRQTLVFGVTAFATCVAGLGAFYAYTNLKESINHQITDKTMLYIQRWNDTSYIPLRATAKRIHEDMKKQPLEQQDGFLVEYFETHPEERQQVITILNFLTEMALCVEEELVDERLLRGFFESIVHDYCEDFHAFINQRRGNNHNRDRYRSLIRLSERWKTRTF